MMTRAIAIVPLLLLASSVVGCGGTSEIDRPVATSQPKKSGSIPAQLLYELDECDRAVAKYNFFVLEAFDEDRAVNDGSRPDETLGWWASDDGTNPNRSPAPPQTGMFLETRSTDRILPQEGGAPSLTGGSCDPSERAIRVVSEAPGFAEWGYTLGANTNGGAAADATTFADGGLAFWIKGKGAVSEFSGLETGVTLFASVPDRYTDSDQNTFCNQQAENELQCDPFGRGVTARDRWQLVLLPFDEMQQRGFGMPSELDGPDLENLIRFQFNIGLGAWDVWIDQVSFYWPIDTE